MNASIVLSEKRCRRCRGLIEAGESLYGYCLPCLLSPALRSKPPVDYLKINRFAPYEIATRADGSFVELGRGSMGVTYRAIDTNLRVPVALKVLNLRIASEEGSWERFLREAQAAASLSHPHVVRVLYYGIAQDGQCYYAMELLEGETLADIVRHNGPLPARDALEVIAQVAIALEAAEKKGLVHRDLKPANLMLLSGPGISVKVIDFGVAKVIGNQEPGGQMGQGAFVGTPAFASPEQLAGGEIDQRSDYFSLGSTLFFLLTGKPPFKADTIRKLTEQIGYLEAALAELKAVGIPFPVRRLVARLLSLLPEKRPQSGSSLVKAIQRCRRTLMIPRFCFNAVGVSATVVGLGIVMMPLLQRSGYFSAGDGPKSIAVLPFFDLSPAKENSFFADGIQDEILTNLAKIADLQVISHSSVDGYRGANRRPAAEIGQVLHVHYLLNGSVRREGNRIRVTAHLEDTTNGHELWANRYDGELTDTFAIQTELAEAICHELRARLSLAEEGSLQDIPTQDFGAYELYLHAKEILTNYDARTQGPEPMENAVRFLNEAVSRDPNFALAWSWLATSHDYFSWLEEDVNDGHREAAENALDTALRLRPNLGEVHLARGFHLMVTTHDYRTIRRELEIARRTLPNSTSLLNQLGNIDRLQGQWRNALEDFKKEATLDPKDIRVRMNLYTLYQSHRQYDQLREISKEFATSGPGAQSISFRNAEAAWNEKGDTSGWRALFDEAAGPLRGSPFATIVKIYCALADRNFAAAERILGADPGQEFELGRPRLVCHDWILGWIKRLEGDQPAAVAAFCKARRLQLIYVQKMPDEPGQLMLLALGDAGAGREEDAMSEARRAASMETITEDAMAGPVLATDLAEVYVWAGEKELAIRQLESLKGVPGALTYGELAKLPDWDPVRSDPRFQKLLSELKPIPILNRGDLAKQ